MWINQSLPLDILYRYVNMQVLDASADDKTDSHAIDQISKTNHSNNE